MRRKLLTAGGIVLACIVFLGALAALTRLVAPKYHDALIEGHITGNFLLCAIECTNNIEHCCKYHTDGDGVCYIWQEENCLQDSL